LVDSQQLKTSATPYCDWVVLFSSMMQFDTILSTSLIENAKNITYAPLPAIDLRGYRTAISLSRN
jgi:hypothetical protein